MIGRRVRLIDGPNIRKDRFGNVQDHHQRDGQGMRIRDGRTLKPSIAMSRAERRVETMTDRNTRPTVTGRARSALLAGGLVAVLSIVLTSCGAADVPAGTTASSSSNTSSTAAMPPSGTLTSGGTATSESGLTVPSTAVDVTTPESALASIELLATLPVQGRASQTGYSREQFGQAWSDDVSVDGGHNGCDTRNDVLRRDISDAQIKPGTHGCVVLSGILADPYSGTVVPFLRGATTSDDVQIDHMVALSDAWQSGAQQLSVGQRRNLANDPINLQATLGWLNQQKGAGDAATWLPPNKNYRCTYVARLIEVKAKYQLWVKPAEKDAMTRVLGDCGAAIPATETEPSSQIVTPLPSVPQTSVAPNAVSPPATASSAAAAAESFRNCAAARAAGAAPVYVGDPGYSTKLDGDLDGIACE
jgi:Excalibur calcium-binding domain/Protein of unknown function (DUF1524)